MDLDRLPIHLSFQLMILGFFSSSAVDFARGLIVKLDDHPRLKANWRFFPFIVGALAINLFPSIVPTTDLLILWAHGAGSPLIAYGAYPYLEKAFTPKGIGAINGKDPATPTPTKDGTK